MIDPRSGSIRESARLEMPEALRNDVRLLGDLLGQVLTEAGGAALLEDVEHLRQIVIAARTNNEKQEEAERLVASWSLERAAEVTRAFTCYFHLVNLAEERHRTRALRQHNQGNQVGTESLAGTIAELKNSLDDDLWQSLSELQIYPVLTAHPTEARRRAVTTAIARIGKQLNRIDDPRASGVQHQESKRRLLEEIDILWRTSQLRSNQVQPLDEVRSVMSIFDETLFRVVPKVYRSLDWSLSPHDIGMRPSLVAAFLRFGSWVGGDRDGNDHITAAVTLETMKIQSQHVLLGLEHAAVRIGRTLTADTLTTPPSTELRQRLYEASSTDPSGMGEIATRSSTEPHRQFLLRIADRLKATRWANSDLAYPSPSTLLNDLRVAQASLVSAGSLRSAYGELQQLIWQVETFGFHLAGLEIRQHSQVHAQALEEIRSGKALSPRTEEVLATLRAMATLQKQFGVEACHRYVISFTREISDITTLYELAAVAGGTGDIPVLDVIPLLETATDLQRATSIATAMLDLEPVLRRFKDTGRELEIMLGYSDSTKEIGPVSASLALYKAQGELAAWAKENSIRLTLFHGRGGALGRGGGPANRAVMAQAPNSVAGRFKVTEQGEVVFARYGNIELAQRHLEQITSAVLLTSTPKIKDRAARADTQFRQIANQVDDAARVAYEKLINHPKFGDWFAQISPIEELGSMRIGSRPTRRNTGRNLDDLRAVPWVFAWSQIRLNLPGWYGLGSGLSAANLNELRLAYREWPLFNVMLDNAEMSLAKTDRRIASYYLELGAEPQLTEQLIAEYDLTIQQILAVTEHSRLLENRRVLSWAVELRNPYVDALSHLQLRALKALRSSPAENERVSLERLFLLTVNGVAAGLQNTG